MHQSCLYARLCKLPFTLSVACCGKVLCHHMLNTAPDACFCLASLAAMFYREALRGYPTTINEDLTLLRDAPSGSREELAIRVRLFASQHPVPLCHVHRTVCLSDSCDSHTAGAWASCVGTELYSNSSCYETGSGS